ncbi:PHA accumulation regulator DNA-binding protein [Desulfamplus magnetovallimortis]|uniref:PHA accumulation regulator DNA-binding protein n=1 Tax=Desulfamplus magnetovallimortis TaxID=1246637 RepID=A0A1W1HCP3_9BACT|nr:polyhydroxyalkanoate synthesis regulator DNA-binding domain-containing protein [Desulfamplus magnetovallimortis]SLM30206.1 PHA accumulation regulator DNA-binding protein [Desulfamplus magnetovallimortis]
MHLIKKYANRKLYDTEDKKYVTMKHISAMIKSGKDVSIVDNETGEDITASIVSTLMGKDSSDAGEGLSTGVLIQLFRKGSGALTDYAKKYFSIWQNAFTMAEDELDALLKTLVKNKEISKTEGSRLKQEITGFTRSLKSWISEMVDKRVNEVMVMMNLPTRDQFTSLNSRISDLEAKIKELESCKRDSGEDDETRL